MTFVHKGSDIHYKQKYSNSMLHVQQQIKISDYAWGGVLMFISIVYAIVREHSASWKMSKYMKSIIQSKCRKCIKVRSLYLKDYIVIAWTEHLGQNAERCPL